MLKTDTTVRIAPGPPGHALWGNTAAFLRDPLAMLVDGWRRYGDVVRFRFVGGQEVYSLTHPEAVKHVLQDQQVVYRKNRRLNDVLRPLVGENLFTSEGDTWLRQRRLMQPAFHRQHVAGLAGVMTEAAGRLMNGRWVPLQAGSGTSRILDVDHEMRRLTLDIVARALFGADIGDQTEIIGRAVGVVLRHTDRQISLPAPLPGWLPLPSFWRLRAALRVLDRTVFGIIEQRRARGQDPGDLLDLLLASRAVDGSGMDDQQLRDQVLTLLIVGHETTAVGLTWVFYLLAQHPAVAGQLRSELHAVLGGRLPTIADLPRLPVTLMVIQETLRLYPPAWAISRTPTVDDVVCGWQIPAGAPVIVNTYALHRHPAFWEDPERFAPERFAADRTADRPRFAYLPFGAGPRQCIGLDFALMEMQLLLATIGQRFRLELTPGQKVSPEVVLTLRPRGGLPMVLRPMETE